MADATCTRSIKLKLIVPRAPERADTAKALWTTHVAVNTACRYYEQQLVLMRGGAYETKDGRVAEEQVVAALLDQARTAQRRNQADVAGRDEEIVDLLRQLYADIVPSALGEDGNAQAANAFLGPLTDTGSRGLLEVFEKIGETPNWMAAARDGEVEAFEAAFLWLEGEVGRKRLRATGSPAGWMRLAKLQPRAPDWVLAFIADFDRKSAEAAGAPTRIRRLKELGVLPLFDAYFRGKIVGADSTTTRWDRLAFRLAVGHLLSWESWCRRAAADHARRRDRLARFEATHVGEAIRPRLDGLRRYERERHAEIVARGDLPEGERPFRIRPRMVRGWRDLREVWLKAKNRDHDGLVAQIAATQAKLRGRFGDPHLFRWLSRPENHPLWDRADEDLVGIFAALNAHQDVVDASRATALLTLPDPVLHPRAVQWEAEGGSNFKTYRLQATSQGLRLDLPVLKSAGDQRYEEQVLGRIGIAASGQMTEIELTRDGNKRLIRYTANNSDRLQAKLGSADLLLDWSHARNRPIEQVIGGDIGPAWLKLALALEPQLPAGWEARRPPALDHFRTAAGKASRHRQGVRAGLRVLSVDLGVRSFAACAVFELTDRVDTNRLAFAADDLDLVAVHERSFLLELPGERADSAASVWREQATEELRRLRRGLARCRRVRQLIGLEGEARRLALGALRDSLTGVGSWPFESVLLDELATSAEAPPAIWDSQVNEAFVRWRNAYGLELSAWRQRTRAPSTEKRSGKSIWSIQHLTDTRRLLQGWSLLGRETGDVRRLDRERGGVFAADLLAHLDGLKEDRIKTGADLIVQAARGQVRDGRGNWEQRHRPCQIVVFEDLSRYRMRTDRPRRENAQLMRWAHRAIIGEVTMQGQLYGLHVTDVSAAFSSRFHAASGTPGLRCHALTRHDLDDPFMQELLGREVPGLDLAQAEAGDLVPLAGGEIFVAPAADGGGLVRLHADLNAAQNLQRRFWTRHGEAFRLPARRMSINDRVCWVPLRLGERLKGALGGHGMLEPTGHDSGSCRWRALSPTAWRRLVGGQAEEGSEPAVAEAVDLEDEMLAELEEEILERSGEVIVFFRDPSGITLPEGLWYPARTFWSMVRAKTLASLRRASCGGAVAA